MGHLLINVNRSSDPRKQVGTYPDYLSSLVTRVVSRVPLEQSKLCDIDTVRKQLSLLERQSIAIKMQKLAKLTLLTWQYLHFGVGASTNESDKLIIQTENNARSIELPYLSDCKPALKVHRTK